MKILNRLRSLFRRDQLDRDMVEEMRFHLDERTDDHVEDGIDPHEARAAAHRKFGGVAQIQERARDLRGWTWLENLWRDFRFAARSLRKCPSFTLTSLLILSLSIATIALVRLFYDTMLLTEAPYVRPNLVQLLHKPDGAPVWSLTASWVDYERWRDRATSFSEIAASRSRNTIAGIDGFYEEFESVEGTGNLFRTLGTPTIRGRSFTEDDCRPDAEPVVVISHRLWRSRFGGATDILGRTIDIGTSPDDRVAHVIIGVTPPGFHFPERTDLWYPLVEDPAWSENPRARILAVIGLFRSGISYASARSELAAIVASYSSGPEGDTSARGAVNPLSLMSHLGYLWEFPHRFLTAALIVQLLAGVNLAGLILARGVRRFDHTAVRAALGASRLRLMRETLVETSLLTVAGIAAGILLAVVVRPFVVAAIKPRLDLPAWWTFQFSGSVIGYTAIVAAAVVIGLSVVPAWLHSNPALSGHLGAMGAARTSKRPMRLISLAVAVQIAVAAVLLAGAALTTAEVQAFRHTDLGIDPRNVSRFMPVVVDRTPQELPSFYQEALRTIAATPGVEAVGAARSPPGMRASTRSVQVESEGDSGVAPVRSQVRTFGPGMLDVLKLPLLYGRDFATADFASAESVVLIDTTLAGELFPDSNPLGRRISLMANPEAPPQWETVIGVVAPSRIYARDEEYSPSVYQPLRSDSRWLGVQIFYRMAGDWVNNAQQITESIRKIDPNVAFVPGPVGEDYETSMEQLYWAPLCFGRAMTWFAVVGFVIAAIGVYGLGSLAVGSRTREIGIRLALGATAHRVVREIMSKLSIPVLVGLGCGAVFAFLYAPKLEHLFTKVSPTNPLIHALAVVFLLLAAGLTSWIPARRAATIDPAETLRAE